MLRPLSVLILLAGATAVAAQEVPQVYQQQKSSTAFHVDGVTRQEWTDDVPFGDGSRRLYRFKPRVEFNANWVQLGLGGDFVYGSDHNTDIPPGMTTLPLLRDNYKSRNARLDLAFIGLSPMKEIKLQGGRLPMPIRFTEMIWDRDLRVQGGAATLEFGGVGPMRFGVTGVYARGSHILPEEGAFKFEGRDIIWIGSATASFSAGAKDRIELIGSYLDFRDTRFVDTRLRRQNTRVAGVIAVPFQVWDFVARYHGEGRVSTTLVADYSWNSGVSEDNKGLWLAMVLGSTISARGSLEYTYASVDKDATLAAYSTDDFIWGTGWSGHRLDLGVRMSDRASSHIIGQIQKFKDSPILAERDTYLNRYRLEVRVRY